MRRTDAPREEDVVYGCREAEVESEVESPARSDQIEMLQVPIGMEGTRGVADLGGAKMGFQI